MSAGFPGINNIPVPQSQARTALDELILKALSGELNLAGAGPGPMGDQFPGALANVDPIGAIGRDIRQPPAIPGPSAALAAAPFGIIGQGLQSPTAKEFGQNLRSSAQDLGRQAIERSGVPAAMAYDRELQESGVPTVAQGTKDLVFGIGDFFEGLLGIDSAKVASAMPEAVNSSETAEDDAFAAALAGLRAEEAASPEARSRQTLDGNNLDSEGFFRETSSAMFPNFSMPMNFPKREIAEQLPLDPIDFSEVNAILESVPPEVIPPMSKSSTVISILGAMASGFSQGLASTGDTGLALGAMGAAAAGQADTLRQEDSQRITINNAQQRRAAETLASMKAQQILGNAGIDARNVEAMNNQNQLISDAKYEFEKSLLPNMQISADMISAQVPNPQTGRMEVITMPGPSTALRRMLVKAQIASAFRGGRGRSGAGGSGKLSLDDIKIGIGVAPIPADSVTPETEELWRGALLWTLSLEGSTRKRQLLTDAVEGRSEDPLLNHLAGLGDMDALETRVTEDLMTERMQQYQLEMSETGNTESGNQDRSGILPLDVLRARRLGTLEQMADEAGAADPMLLMDLQALGGFE